ncbi:mechanosensitive ion channel family protein [Thiosocius teredinicola]|uniref:mechanosensitive ion channel family protein n=1 Tax=Thiosocius teredinicola TaxID=1973002 RepID=UPI000990B628
MNPSAAPTPPTPPPEPPPSALQEVGVNLIDQPALWLDQAINGLTTALKIFLPNLLGGIALLLLGWLVAFLARWLIMRFGKGLDAILAVVHRWTGQEVSQPRWSVSTFVATITFWMIFVYAVSAAAEQIGLDTFATWVLSLLGYLPSLLISLFILFIGYLVAGGVRNLILAVAESNGFQHGLTLGHLSAGLIMAFTLLLGLSQLGLDVTLFANIITLAAAALFISVALAFGIGAADAVRNVLASHYVRKAFQPGQHVRIESLQGEILELTQIAVLVGTEEGEAWVPARQFLDKVTLILEDEEV